MTDNTHSAQTGHVDLTRRERQIMDILYAREEAGVQDILDGLPDEPNYSTVRALLRKLLDKGHVVYRQDGARYVYRPVVQKAAASRSAFRRLLDTFFSGSPREAVVSLLGEQGDSLSREDIREIERELDRLKQRRSRG